MEEREHSVGCMAVSYCNVACVGPLNKSNKSKYTYIFLYTNNYFYFY